jgi:hypothetical protein
LAARKERLKQRREHVFKIARGLNIGRKDIDLYHQFHHLVFLGDMNYRVESDWATTLAHIEAKEWDLLGAQDQLRQEMGKLAVFPGFKEGTLNFTPSYRWEKRVDSFSNKRFQSPSWTDRILIKTLPFGAREDAVELGCTSAKPAAVPLARLGEPALRQTAFGAVHAVKGSDHRPVYAHFVVQPQLPYHFFAPTITRVSFVVESVRVVWRMTPNGHLLSLLAEGSPSSSSASEPIDPTDPDAEVDAGMDCMLFSLLDLLKCITDRMAGSLCIAPHILQTFNTCVCVCVCVCKCV